jgi:hypothetical protein
MATLRIPYAPSTAADAVELAPPPRQRLPHRWSHGRAYVVIALLAPLVLGSLALLSLHTVLQSGLQQARVSLRKAIQATQPQ